MIRLNIDIDVQKGESIDEVRGQLHRLFGFAPLVVQSTDELSVAAPREETKEDAPVPPKPAAKKRGRPKATKKAVKPEAPVAPPVAPEAPAAPPEPEPVDPAHMRGVVEAFVKAKKTPALLEKLNARDLKRVSDIKDQDELRAFLAELEAETE